MGIVIMKILQFKLKDQSSEGIKEYLDSKFAYCKNLYVDLKTGYDFWNMLMRLVQVMCDHKAISEDIVNQFFQANAFLNQRLELLKIIPI